MMSRTVSDKAELSYFNFNLFLLQIRQGLILLFDYHYYQLSHYLISRFQ